MGFETVLTTSEGLYLKSIYKKQVEEGKRAKTTVLARSFGVAPATVTEILHKLSEKRLVRYTPYHGVEITEGGLTEAQKLIRKHRLLEVLLVRHLNYTPKKACEEASQIDTYCSGYLINAICQTYNHPKTCPCDKTISRNQECCKDMSEQYE